MGKCDKYLENFHPNVGYYLLMFKEENLSHCENVTTKTHFSEW